MHAILTLINIRHNIHYYIYVISLLTKLRHFIKLLGTILLMSIILYINIFEMDEISNSRCLFIQKLIQYN